MGKVAHIWHLGDILEDVSAKGPGFLGTCLSAGFYVLSEPCFTSPESVKPPLTCMQNQTSVPCALDSLLLRSRCKFLLFLAALDSPSSGVCSTVHSQDRLPCASLPISQGDCEVRGCCYNPRDKVKTCYYGNTGECEWPSSPLMW